MERLNLQDYGKQVGQYFALFDLEGHMIHFNNIFNKSKEGYTLYTHSILDNDSVLFSIKDGTFQKEPVPFIFKYGVNYFNKLELRSLMRKEDDPIYINMHNTNGVKSEDGYTYQRKIITPNNKNRVMNFIFDNDEIAMLHKDKCLIHRITSGEEFANSHLVRKIYYSSKYFVTIDSEEESIIYENIKNGLYISYKLFTNKCPFFCLLDHQPTEINYWNDNDEFHATINYDNYGMISSCEGQNQTSYTCRYEVFEDDEYKIILSIHPLFYDPFDYKFIDYPFQYFAFDSLYQHKQKGNKYSYKREIYKIKDPKKLLKYLTDINSIEKYASILMIDNN